MNAMKTTALLLLLVAAIATSSYGSDNDVDGIVPEEYLLGQGTSALELQRDNADQSKADSSAKADNEMVPGVDPLSKKQEPKAQPVLSASPVKVEHLQADEILGGLNQINCTALDTSPFWGEVLGFVKGFDTIQGPGPSLHSFKCLSAWTQVEDSGTVWIGGKCDQSLCAVHVRPVPDTNDDVFVKPLEPSAEHVDFAEPSITKDGHITGLTAQQALSNRYEILQVQDLSMPNPGVPSAVGHWAQGLRHSVPAKHAASVEPAEAFVSETSKDGLGYIEPTPEQIQAGKDIGFIEEMPAPSSELIASIPDEYDFKERYPNATANKIESQGTCGSCWAFAAAKAYGLSLYKQSQGRYNIRLAPQHAVSCLKKRSGYHENDDKSVYGVDISDKLKDGCEGGNALDSWWPMKTEPGPTEFCDPYTGHSSFINTVKDRVVKDECGTKAAQCSGDTDDLNYEVEKVYLVANNEHSIKSAIIDYGAVEVGVEWDDSNSEYTEGIFSQFDKGPKGGHSMVIVGWGVQNGQKYWKIANSHGNKYPNNKNGYYFWAIDSPGAPIGSVWAVVPKLPTQCATATKCENGGAFKQDCSCRCPSTHTGAQCETCNLNCQNGGTLSGCSCSCPAGVYGPNCEYYIKAYWKMAYKPSNSGMSSVVVEWKLPTLHKGTNTLQRYTSPHGKSGCSNCATLADFTTAEGSKETTLDGGSLGTGRPKGEHCYRAVLSNGNNEFGAPLGEETVKLPCFRWAEGMTKAMTADGTSGKCVCGGTDLAPGSVMDALQCPQESYKENCCPNSPEDCMGRTGRSSGTSPARLTCSDAPLPSGGEWHDSDGPTYNCAYYAKDGNQASCAKHGDQFPNEGVTANVACCDCGGGVKRIQAASSEPSASPTPQPTESPTTETPTGIPTDAPTTNAPTDSPTPQPTESPTTDAPTESTTGVPTDVPTTNAHGIECRDDDSSTAFLSDYPCWDSGISSKCDDDDYTGLQIRKRCPATCGVCTPECRDDDSSSAWLSRYPCSRMIWRCNYHDDYRKSRKKTRKRCPVTCGVCTPNDSPGPPTESPTGAPTDSPTPQPTELPTTDAPTESPTGVPTDVPTTNAHGIQCRDDDSSSAWLSKYPCSSFLSWCDSDKYGSQTRKRCPATCSACAPTECRDDDSSSAWLSQYPCSGLLDWCNSDKNGGPDTRHRCPASCGLCTPTDSASSEPSASPTPQPTESVCQDKTLVSGDEWYDGDGPKYNCALYDMRGLGYCRKFGHGSPREGLTANQACCACGGGNREAQDEDSIVSEELHI